MNRLFEIATELGVIAQKRLANKQNLVTTERNIASLEREMIPEGGWPGKNADERKTAELLAKEAYIPMRDLIAEKVKWEENLMIVDAHREVLLAERSAWEWTIRDQECLASDQGLMSVFDLMQEHKLQVEK